MISFCILFLPSWRDVSIRTLWLGRIEMSATAIVRYTIARFRRLGMIGGQIIRPDRRLAVTARNVEHIIRLAQAGNSPPQASHQFLAVGERGAQMRGTGREIAV